MKYFALFGLLFCAGCIHHSNTRYQDGKLIEHSSTFGCLVKGKATAIDSSVQDKDYSRKLSVGEIEGSGDSDMVRAIYEAGKAAGKAAAK